MACPSLPPILIADDESEHEFILRRRLTNAGVLNPIKSFLDGEEVVEFLTKVAHDEVRPELLFLDLKMARLDGFDTLRWIRSRTAWDDLKVVVITSSTRLEECERAKSCGAHSVLNKFPTGPELAEFVPRPFIASSAALGSAHPLTLLRVLSGTLACALRYS